MEILITLLTIIGGFFGVADAGEAEIAYPTETVQTVEATSIVVIDDDGITSYVG